MRNDSDCVREMALMSFAINSRNNGLRSIFRDQEWRALSRRAPGVPALTQSVITLPVTCFRCAVFTMSSAMNKSFHRYAYQSQYLLRTVETSWGTTFWPITIENRKRDCSWGHSGWSWWPLSEKGCRSQSTIQYGEGNERMTDLCFATCRLSQVVFITLSSLLHNLFSYFQ